MGSTTYITITVPADADQDDCLASAAADYIEDHPDLAGYDLSPRWTEDSEDGSNRETVDLSVPAWSVGTPCTIEERGNGLPDVGDYVPGDDGELYRVLRYVGPIHTAGAGRANYCHAYVESADWSDCDEGSEAAAMVILGEEDTATR